MPGAGTFGDRDIHGGNPRWMLGEIQKMYQKCRVYMCLYTCCIMYLIKNVCLYTVYIINLPKQFLHVFTCSHVRSQNTRAPPCLCRYILCKYLSICLILSYFILSYPILSYPSLFVYLSISLSLYMYMYINPFRHQKSSHFWAQLGVLPWFYYVCFFFRSQWFHSIR